MKPFALAGLTGSQINMMTDHGYKNLRREDKEVYGQKKIQKILNA